MQFVPEIRTDRLLLRRLTEHDWEDYARICGDPETMRYIGDGKPLDRTAAWHNMAMIMGHWGLRNYGMWGVVLRESGEFIGRIGLHNPAGWPGVEVAWLIDRAYWGHGYASEGGKVALGFAFQNLGAERVLSLIHPENESSKRVATKLGGVLDQEETVNGHRVLIYEYT